ncbi:MAG: MFS transporter [Gammaproteobacteria bacterium]|nr:MFS transporter [Gammaproteobacteria bacterium]MDG1951314.1 MFS transporter [Gammaproteobacteria bacterium]MDG2119512.1 MFS transporter [Gammaproteobacteria bacterium]
MMLFMPIIWLFYEANGLTIRDLFVIQSIYSVTIVLIEIPSGYIADVFGRKNSMVVGTFFSFLGILTYTLSFGFDGFLLASLCLGIGQSFVSGSDTAIMYDSLAELNRSEDFIKLEGRTISMGNFAEATAFVIGGFLAQISLRTPFYYQVGIALVGFIIALLLVEPKITRLEDGAIKPWKNIKRIIRYALVEKSILRAYIFYSAIVGVATLTMAWFAQPYLKTLNIGIVYFGIIGAGLNLAVAITSFYAHEIERKINTRILFSLILLFIVSGYFTIAYLNNLWGLSILILFYMTRGVATPLLRDYMNRHTPSEMRATVMSIRSFVIRIFFASTSPMLGYVADVYSLQNALYLSGALFFVFGLLILIYLISESNAQSIDPPTATQV